MTRSLATTPRPFPESSALAGPAQPSLLVRTSPGAIRSLRESRAAAQRLASKYPPIVEGHVLSPAQEAILRVLPSSVGVPMSTAAVVLALNSREPAIEVTLSACAALLTGMWDLELVRVYARPFEDPEAMRWTRASSGEAVALTEQYAVDRALGNGGHP